MQSDSPNKHNDIVLLYFDFTSILQNDLKSSSDISRPVAA